MPDDIFFPINLFFFFSTRCLMSVFLCFIVQSRDLDLGDRQRDVVDCSVIKIPLVILFVVAGRVFRSFKTLQWTDDF